MLRTAAALSALVLVAWLVLTAAAVRSGDALAGVAVFLLGLSALLALVPIWLTFALARSVVAARRAARELRG
jgi:hypothetical protein